MKEKHPGGAARPSLTRLPLAAALAAALLMAAGCRVMNRAATKSFYFDRQYGRITSGTELQRSAFVFTEDHLEDAALEGVAEAGSVEVHYQGGLELEARRLAGYMDAIIAAAQEQTGFEILYGLRLYLLRVDVLPQKVRFRVTTDHAERFYSAPVFVEAGARRRDGALFFPAHPFHMLHELVELSLVKTDGPYRVAPDLGWGPFRIVNGTRWFREGYASYLGFVGAEFAREELGLDMYYDHLQWGNEGVRPLMRLVAGGRGLFRWHQFSPRSRDDMHYDGSLGLFLLMRHRFGEDTIREIAAELSGLDRPDGRSLREMVRQVTGEDPVEMVEDLRFPQTGLSLVQLSPAEAESNGLGARTLVVVVETAEGSPAAAAGLVEGDILVAANHRPVKTFFDIEYAIIESMESGEILLSVERRGAVSNMAVSLEGARALTRDHFRRIAAKDDAPARWTWRGSVWVRLESPSRRTTRDQIEDRQ